MCSASVVLENILETTVSLIQSGHGIESDCNRFGISLRLEQHELDS